MWPSQVDKITCNASYTKFIQCHVCSVPGPSACREYITLGNRIESHTASSIIEHKVMPSQFPVFLSSAHIPSQPSPLLVLSMSYYFTRPQSH